MFTYSCLQDKTSFRYFYHLLLPFILTMEQNNNIYLIPNFQPSEIISYFSEHGITILQSDILKPSFQNTVRIYNSLANLLLANTNMTGEMDESKFLLMTYKNVDQLLKKLGINFFELKDLQFPSYKRNLNFLSTIYNFCIFRDSKKEYYDKAMLKKEEHESLLNEINSSIEITESKLKKMEENALKRKKENEKLLTRINKLEEEVQSIYKEQRDEVNKIEEMKRERDEMCDKLSSLKLTSLNIKQDVNEMKAQVIDDPTKMLNLIDEMQALISSERASVDNFTKKLKHIINQVMVESTEKTRMQNAIQLALSQKNKLKTLNGLETEVMMLEKTKNIQKSSIAASQKRIDHLNRQLKHIHEKLETIKNKDRENSSELSASLSKLKDNYAKIKLERSNYNEKISQNQKEIKEIEYKMLQMMNQHQRDMHRLVNKVVDLKNAANKYFMEFEDFNRDFYEMD